MINYKIIIPTYNENEHLSRCLKWLDSYSHLKNVIVVNDNDPQYPSMDLKNTYIINTGGNAWWNGSINLGIEKALSLSSDYLILLNSDNWGETDVISELLMRAQLNDRIIHAATVVNQNGIVRCTSGILKIENFTVEMFNYGKSIESLKERTLYGNYNGGMAVVLSRYVIENVGLLDEYLPLSADRDYFYKAFTMGIPVCGYEDILIYTDDEHKAIDRDEKYRSKFVRKLFEPLNFRSPHYFKNIYHFYKKYTLYPLSLTIKSLLHFYNPYK